MKPCDVPMIQNIQRKKPMSAAGEMARMPHVARLVSQHILT